MKRLCLLPLSLLLFACAGSKNQPKSELYEVLKSNDYQGAEFRFYEIITEPKEFVLLLNDPDLKRKVKADDIQKANFVVLHAGEKTTGGYSIFVRDIKETPDAIIITVGETAPQGMAITAMTYPMTVIKVNSKKRLEFKEE